MSTSNNPFALPELSLQGSAAQRFPAIDGIGSGSSNDQQQYYQQQQQGYPQQQQGGGGGGGGYVQQSQQQLQPMYAQPTGYGQTPAAGGFTPSSHFGQYLQSSGGQLNFGSSDSSSNRNSNYGSSAYYNPSPQPQRNQNQLVADLDPFSAGFQQQQRMNGPASGGGGGGYQAQPQQQIQYQTTPQQQETRQQEQYGEHPRSFMRANKSELETWNQQAWGRARALFVQLEKAWEGRKKLVSEWQVWSLGFDDREMCEKVRTATCISRK